jgi:capsid assembly protease
MLENSLNQRFSLLTRSPFWAILPDALTVLVGQILKGHIPWEAAKPGTQSNGKASNKTAIIPIQGVLTKDGPSWLGSTYNAISAAAEHAEADPAVKRVILAVDSPGGEVMGLPETAAVLAQVAKIKPVSAIVEGMSASAAYWLTSQAGDITLTPSGEVGSVGVRMMHMDISKMLEDAGVKVTELYSGNYKTEWSPFKPVTDDAKEDMTTRLVAVHRDFLNDITSGRGNRASAEIKKARYGEGRMFRAQEATAHGLVDRVQSPHEFYRAILSTQEQKNSTPALYRARLELERHRF